SSKFWEVSLDGTTVKTRYGKIGTAGQQTVKDFDSKGEAFKELDKLVTEKTKKGYAEGGVAGGAAAAANAGSAKGDARNPELEKAIVANPFDKDAYAVLADWLQEQGDPRGELISLQLAGKDKPAQQMIDKQADYFLGPLAEHTKVHDEGSNNSTSHLRTKEQEKEWQKTQQQAFLWRNGFIYRVRLSHDSYSDEEFDGSTAEILDSVLRHPSGRFVVELAFMSNGDPNEDNLQSLIDVLAKKAPPTVRKLSFGDNVDQISWHHIGNLGKLWKAVPNLQILEIETGEFDVGKMEAPNLERAVFITGGLAKACGKNIATAVMPKIKHLEVYYGTDNYGGDCTIKEVRPLLDRTDLEQLEYLGLKNSEFGNDIAKAVVDAKIVKGLKTLDLSMSTITDEGAAALAAGAAKLAHLECLDLTHNYLTKDGIKAVKSICKKVVTEDQQTPNEWGDGELHYYCAITE
ncbi:MAG: WGR domain-containing protein, partial [Kofleriaceae bacterium]